VKIKPPVIALKNPGGKVIEAQFFLRFNRAQT
jgi:hypothetical protein